MKRRVLASILGIAMLTTFMPVSAETDEAAQTQTEAPAPQESKQVSEPVQAPDPTKAPAEEQNTEAPAAEEPKAEPTEAPATPEPFKAKVKIELKTKGALYFGNEVTLHAKVEEANAKYTAVWQYYNKEADVKHGEDPWVALDKGENYKFTLNEENAVRSYRVVLNGEVISKTYELPKVTEKPEEAEEPETEEEVEDSEEIGEEETEVGAEESAEAEVEEEIEEPAEEEVEEPAEEEVPAEEETEEPETEEEVEEPEETAEPETEEEETIEEAEKAAEAPELDPDRSIAIHAEWEGEELHFGDEVTLIADLSGYDNAVYEIQWQTSKDNASWTDVEGATEASCTMVVTEENYQDYWHVVVTVTGLMVAN